MNSFSLEANSENELPIIAKKLLEFAMDKKVFLFYGEMGTGKTTFIKCICNALGVQDNLSSPTFSIVNEYNLKGKYKVFHFDFYRLKNLEECLNIGIEDYLNSGNFCFVEWPEIAERIYPEPQTVRVKISIDGMKRNFDVSF
jgi:tRNA threonylcarbamoyladenosine biosynthesis protein TsaE